MGRCQFNYNAFGRGKEELELEDGGINGKLNIMSQKMCKAALYMCVYIYILIQLKKWGKNNDEIDDVI